MHLSFRNRLTFFFILLVILPVLAVASVGILIVRNSEEGKNNDALEQAQRAAEGLYNDAEERAVVVARTVQLDDELAVAVRDGDRAAQQARLEALARRGGAQLVRLTLDGQEPVEAGPGNEVVAPARSRVLDADGRRAGMLSLSVTSASAYANLLARVTGQEVVLTQDGELVASTIEGVSGRGPAPERRDRDRRRRVPRHGLQGARVRRGRDDRRPRARPARRTCRTPSRRTRSASSSSCSRS